MSRARAAGLVLAAGGGARFGATKQLAEVDGAPLVGHAVATARAAGLDPVLVVVGHDAPAVRTVLPAQVEVVDNPAHRGGQATSLRAGVAAATTSRADALVVLLADQPGIAASTVTALLDAHADGALAVRARYDDRPGHPVLFDRTIWPALARVEGDRGARDLLADLPVTEVRVAGPCPPDVDTPADLERLRSGERPSGRA